MNDMREWLDRYKATISHFRSATAVEGTVTITVGFTATDANTDAFERRFVKDRPSGPISAS